jgi:Helix-turn-helix domain
MDRLLTVKEVANILRVSDDTVVRLFACVEGVIDLGSPETRRKQGYRVLRIPKTAVERFLVSRGGRFRIEIPEPDK